MHIFVCLISVFELIHEFEDQRAEPVDEDLVEQLVHGEVQDKDDVIQVKLELKIGDGVESDHQNCLLDDQQIRALLEYLDPHRPQVVVLPHTVEYEEREEDGDEDVGQVEADIGVAQRGAESANQHHPQILYKGEIVAAALDQITFVIGKIVRVNRVDSNLQP